MPDQKRTIEDGNVLLYRRGKVWYMRYYKGNRKYALISLKTKNEKEAEHRARRAWWEIERNRAEGRPDKPTKFADVIAEYVRMRERNYEQTKDEPRTRTGITRTSYANLRQIKRVSRYWIEYAGNTETDQIRSGDLRKYVDWRRTYWRDKPNRPRNTALNPTDKTMDWETTFIKTVLKWAEGEGYRKENTRIQFSIKMGGRVNVRPAFTLIDYRKLWNGLRRNIDEKKNYKLKERLYHAELLRDYVLILANTGMRVGEANNLKETDVQIWKDNTGFTTYKFYVDGKNGKREVVGRKSVNRYVERVIARNALRDEEEKAKGPREATSGGAAMRKNVDRGNWFFSMWDRNKIISLIDQFKYVLKLAGIETNNYGEKYTIYSLRHMYGRMALSKDPKMLWAIARNMGMSLKIAERYYLRDTPREEEQTMLVHQK